MTAPMTTKVPCSGSGAPAIRGLTEIELCPGCRKLVRRERATRRRRSVEVGTLVFVDHQIEGKKRPSARAVKRAEVEAKDLETLRARAKAYTITRSSDHVGDPGPKTSEDWWPSLKEAREHLRDMLLGNPGEYVSLYIRVAGEWTLDETRSYVEPKRKRKKPPSRWDGFDPA